MSDFLKEYDPEISESVEKALIEQGINLVKGATFERVEQSGRDKKGLRNSKWQ